VDPNVVALADAFKTALAVGPLHDAVGQTRDKRNAAYPAIFNSAVDDAIFGVGGGSMQISGLATVTVYTAGTPPVTRFDCRVTLDAFTPGAGGSSFTTLPKRPMHLTGSPTPGSGGVTITGRVNVVTPDLTSEDRVITIRIDPFQGITLTNEAYGARTDPASF